MNNNQTKKESINDTKTTKKNFAERIISAKDIQSFDDVINSYRQESLRKFVKEAFFFFRKKFFSSFY